MVVCYLICWLPYGVTALLATFGPPNLLTPEATITPSLLAKFSTVINPFIYIFMNKQVRQESRHFCLFVYEVFFFYVFWTALREGAHVGDGLVHPWTTRQLFAGPDVSICGVGLCSKARWQCSEGVVASSPLPEHQIITQYLDVVLTFFPSAPLHQTRWAVNWMLWAEVLTHSLVLIYTLTWNTQPSLRSY